MAKDAVYGPDSSGEMADRHKALLYELCALLLESVSRTPLDKDILSLAEVSAILRCAEDTLRRVPYDELPAHRVGKANLYLREDVIRYVRSRRVGGESPASLAQDVGALIDDVLDMDHVDVREPSRRRAK